MGDYIPDGHNGNGTTQVHTEVERAANGLLQMKIEAVYEECVGMPGFGSVRWGLRSTLTLGKKWLQPQQAQAVAELELKMGQELKNRVRVMVEGARREAFARAMGYAREAIEAQERIKIEVKDKLAAEGAARHDAAVAERNRPASLPARQEPVDIGGPDDQDDDPAPVERPVPRRRDDRSAGSTRPAPHDRGRDDSASRGRGGKSGGGGGKIDWYTRSDNPTRASQLYGFAKDFERHDIAAIDWFNDYARQEELPKMFQDWPDQEVAQATEEFRRSLRGGR